MKILVTGNLGYIGTVLTKILITKGYNVVGFDSGYYKDCLLENDQTDEIVQIIKDIRHIELSDLENIDAIIHLAGLSNDPLGELVPTLTEEINLQGTIRLADLAKKSGVRRFIYASSQSMYGISDNSSELDEITSEKKPITAYARTKWEAEKYLMSISNKNFLVCAFRPSTVFGYSPRLRCDIVFNNLVACNFTKKRIEIKSDGSPWRPVVHVRDVCEAFLSGLVASDEKLNSKSFNVGIKNGNYTVKDLALAAQSVIPDSKLIFTNEEITDNRSYRVSFDRIYNQLGDYYSPNWNLQSGANELYNKFREISFGEEEFIGIKTNRLKMINHLIESEVIDDHLFMKRENK